jgi:flagellar biosynthesis protein FliR
MPFRFEHTAKPVISRKRYFGRQLKFLLYSSMLMVFGLIVGVFGYHWIAGLNWLDSLLNASMILGGMGPVDVLHTSAAKLFASFYALFSGLVFISMSGILLAPFAHRLLHLLHGDEQMK